MKIQRYPGHIAKAEKELTEYLKKVDVVIEVRDARIPLATSHPMVPTWIGDSKPLIVAISRVDQISPRALEEWKRHFFYNPPYLNLNKNDAHDGSNRRKENTKVFFIDGKTGAGTFPLRKQALLAGVDLNLKRERKGISPRPVRAAIIGYPNVGKSALINRLLNRKLAKSYNKPGVTRQLQWVRLNQDTADQDHRGIDLLDSPGIIPARQVSQFEAVKLAICNDIGEASYDRVAVATVMLEIIRDLHPGYVNKKAINERYSIDLSSMTGETIIYKIADDMYHGNLISAADKLLGDYRRGFFGKTSLECAPVGDADQYEEYELAKKQRAASRDTVAKRVSKKGLRVGEPMGMTRNDDLGFTSKNVTFVELDDENTFMDEQSVLMDENIEFEEMDVLSNDIDGAQQSNTDSQISTTSSISALPDHGGTGDSRGDSIVNVESTETPKKSISNTRKKSLFNINVSDKSGAFDGW